MKDKIKPLITFGVIFPIIIIVLPLSSGFNYA